MAGFLAQDSNLRRLSFAAQVLVVLPRNHPHHYLFVDHEGKSLVVLGFATEAVARYRDMVDAFTRLAQAEPDRADYQRDLSVSYQRLGMCLAQLDRVGDAAAAFERHLQLAIDVQRRLPGQVDAIVDLAVALYLTSGADDHAGERLRQSRDLLEALEADQRLPQNGKALLNLLRHNQVPSQQSDT